MTTGATLRLRSDNDVTFSNGAITLNSDTSSGVDTTSFTFDVNAATSASNKTLTLGTVQYTTNTSGNRGQDVQTINVTGSNGYTLAITNTVPASSNGQAGNNYVYNVASGLTLAMNGGFNGGVSTNHSFTGAGNTTVGVITRPANRTQTISFNQTGTVTLKNAASDGGGGGSFVTAFNAGTTVFNNAAAVNNVQINLGNQTAASTAAATFLLGGGTTGLTGGLTYTGAVRAYDTTSGLLSLGGQNTSGTNTYSNTVTLGNTTNTGKSVNLIAASGGQVDFTGVIARNGTDTTAGVIINGTYGVNGATVNPSGTVRLGNAGNTFAGGLTIAAGTVLQTATNGALGTGTVTLGDGSSASDATLTGNVGTAVVNTNPITIASGGSGTYTIKNISNSDYSFSGNIALNNAATFQTTAGGAMFLSGTITGSSPITIDGGGTTTKFVRLDADNSSSFTGNISVQNKGTLKFNIANSTGTSTAATLDSTSIIDAGGFAMTFAGLNGVSGSSSVLNNGSGLTLGGTGTYSFGGAIANGGTLTKSGAGTQTLSGSNTYTGATTVSAGTLAVSGYLANTASVSVSAGATLNVNGQVNAAATTTVAGLLSGTGSLGTVSVSGTVAPGNSAGTLSTAALTLQSTAAVNFELQNGDVTIGNNVNDLIAVTGNLTLDGTLNITELGGSLVDGSTYRLFNYSGSLTDNTLDISSAFLALHPGSTIDTATLGQINLLVVPEPGAGLMLLSGVAMFGLLRRRRA